MVFVCVNNVVGISIISEQITIGELPYMNINVVTRRKHSMISYIALFFGIICFFITFVQPTRIVMIGSLAGDYITFGFTAIGVILSIVGLFKKTEKKLLPVISFISYFFVLWLILLFTGVWDFAP